MIGRHEPRHFFAPLTTLAELDKVEVWSFFSVVCGVLFF
jgi:hypothetical protein